MTRKRWEGKSGFGALSHELAVSHGLDFQRKALPYIRAVWPEATGTPELGHWDRLGVDHLVWGSGTKLPLVVQCKGFKVLEAEVGLDQAEQCQESVDAFRRSGMKTSIYALVHNRETRSREFTDAAANAVRSLVEDGVADEAIVLDRKGLIKRAFDSVHAHLIEALVSMSLRRTEDLMALESPLAAPIEEVPITEHRIVWNRNHLMSMEPVRAFVADPARHVVAHEGGICLVLAEFGQGKTTAVLRGSDTRAGRFVVVPAAIFSPETTSTRSLLAQCVDLDRFLDFYTDEDRGVIERIARPCLDSALAEEGLDIVLVLDGIDESVFFSRAQGLQHLFNLLEDTRVPVTVTCRTEFWNLRRDDFALPAGPLPKSARSRQRRNLKVIELTAWSGSEIVALARRFEQELAEPEKGRVGQFVSLLESRGYEALYGDIPQRPLFLRMILESIAVMGYQPSHKAQLVEDWIVAKIVRDRRLPIEKGGRGRQPILSELASQTIDLSLAFRAMTRAAIEMTQVHEASVELLPDCSLVDVLQGDLDLAAVADPTGLLLHSVLVPMDPRRPGEPPRLRFGHRALHEYFLARAAVENPGLFDGAGLPAEVEDWVSLLRDHATEL